MASLARLLVAAALIAGPMSAPARANGPHALVVVDANTGATLIDQSGSEPRYPASLTKMMTLYLTFEALEHKSLDMKTRINVSAHAANAAPSKLDLNAGDDIALEDGIFALITKSANDVAIAVAEHIGGTEPNFARMMTAKARELGMTGTTFKNASGLPDSEQVTTARDMVTLGMHLHDDFPRYFPLFSTKSYAYNGASFRNHNTLMLQMPGINGIKTGYTNASGFNLVTSYEVDGKHLIGAIFGGETAASRNVTMRVALSKSLARASLTKSRKPFATAHTQPKAAPEPRVAARRPAPEAPKPSAAPQTAAVQTAAATPDARPALKVSVAKVHAIDLTTRRQQADGAAAVPTAPAPLETAALAPKPVQQPPQTSPAPSTTGPSTFQRQMATLAQNIMPSTSPATEAQVADAASGPATAAPARSPSTLNDQLAQLIRTDVAITPVVSAPNYRLKGPDTAELPQVSSPPVTAPAVRQASVGPVGHYEIQIGAYASPAEAEKHLASAARDFPGPLQGHMPTRQSVQVKDKTLYRARFTGYDAASAASACAELNHRGINCLALKAE